MKEPEASSSPGLKKFGAMKRRPINVAQESLITIEPLFANKSFPLVIHPTVKGASAASWVESHRDLIETLLVKHGALLFRDCNLNGPARFEELIESLGVDLLEYTERSSPRTRVSGNVYTSTDYPQDHSIFLHNENSYQSTWPLKIFFFCATSPAHGGETPIADCRQVCASLDPKIKERFIEKQVMYVRNYGDGFGLNWQEVFQTTDKSVVEEHCRRTKVKYEWKDNQRLRTYAVRPALSKHPRTGELVWFNHATFFHVSTLAPEVRAALLFEFSETELPTNTYYGDGTPIELSVLDELRQCYRDATVKFKWQEGDLLMLDNMLIAHGREPYVGQRKILVAMAEAFSPANNQTA